jgi:hypothetical protein
MKTLRKRATRKVGPSADDLTAARGQLGRLFTARVDAKAILDLDEGEQAELVALVAVTRGDSRREANLGLLGDDRGRLEELVERLAGLEPGTFEAERKRASMLAKVTALATRARTPPPRPKFEQPGAVVLPRQWAFEFLRDGILHAEHLLLLTVLLAMFETGEPLVNASFEEGGEVLVLDRRNFGAGRFDPRGTLGRWTKLLAHLERNGFFVVVSNRGPAIRVRRGPRALAVLKGRAAA